jgi:hypothetical protein
MRDEQNGFALVREILHNLHQFLDLLRRQHCRRLIKDQHLVITVEHLKNLNTLLHTYGDIRNQRIRLHLKPVPLTQLQYLFSGTIFFKEQSFRWLNTKDNIIQHGKTLHQFEVLMNHSDVQIVRVVRRIDLYNLPVLFDRTGRRLVQTKQNTHEGRLSCTVLSKQCMNLSLSQLQGNIIVGFDSWKFFRDVQHLNNIFVFHIHVSSSFFFFMRRMSHSCISYSITSSGYKKKRKRNYFSSPLKSPLTLHSQRLRENLPPADSLYR